MQARGGEAGAATNTMVDRHQARILAMQSLCQLEVLADDFAADLDAFLAEETDSSAVRAYARELVTEVWSNLEAVDQAIQAVAEHWEIKRMATVDRNTLRVAVGELLYRPGVPPAVVINEAVEIGKTFGAADSGAFINGVLDGVVRRRAEAAAREPRAEQSTGVDC